MQELDKISFHRCRLPPETPEFPLLCVCTTHCKKHACTYIRHKPKKTPTMITLCQQSLEWKLWSNLTLQVTVFALHLKETTTDEYRTQSKDAKFLSDNSITLAWIQSPSCSFKLFLLSRADEIQSNLDASQWKHILGEVNIANNLWRGLHLQELAGRKRNGPEQRQSQMQKCTQRQCSRS